MQRDFELMVDFVDIVDAVDIVDKSFNWHFKG